MKYDLNKVPPQANDIEEIVLGVILTDYNAINDAIELLLPDMFYRDSHKKIYQACLNVYRKSGTCDLWLVTENLRDNKEIESVGGPISITKLTTKFVSSANMVEYSLIIKQKYIQRELIRVSTELQSRSFDDTYDVAELFEYAETELLRISGMTQKKEASKLGKLIDRVIDRIQKIINHEIKLIGMPSGFIEIDRKTGGFKEGELIIVASRPSMGKSAVALQIAINMGNLNLPVGLFALEMSGESLAQRSISGVSGKSNVELIEGHCNIDDLIQKTESLANIPVYIDDSAGISVVELRAKTRRMILQYGIKMIIVDYLQLMKGDGQSREQEVSSISRGLKAIAKDLGIPVIAMSQLSRKCEERKDKRPELSDLRESGAIEQDADVVWFPFRPAYYGAKTIFIGNTEEDARDKMEIIIAKNRNGITGSYYLKHNISLTEIKDIDQLTF